MSNNIKLITCPAGPYAYLEDENGKEIMECSTGHAYLPTKYARLFAASSALLEACTYAFDYIHNQAATGTDPKAKRLLREAIALATQPGLATEETGK